MDSGGNVIGAAPENVRDHLAGGHYVYATPEAIQARNAATAPLSDTIAAGAVNLGAHAIDAIQAPVHIPVALGAKALGAADPMANFSGQKTLENLAYVGGELAGQEGGVAARRFAENYRAAAEDAPLAMQIGGVAGDIAGAAAGGLGGAAEKLGAGVAERTGSQLLGRTVAGAGEAATFGPAMADEQSYLGNVPLSADHVVAATGLSALLGGGVAIGTHGVSQLLSRVGSRGATDIGATRAPAGGPYRTDAKAAEALAGKALGDVPPAKGLGDALADFYNGKLVEPLSKAASVISGAPEENIRRFATWDKAGRSARDTLRNADAILEGAKQDITARVGSISSDTPAVTKVVREAEAKRSQVAANLADVDHVAALDAARAHSSQLRADLADLAARERAAATGGDVAVATPADIPSWSDFMKRRMAEGETDHAVIGKEYQALKVTGGETGQRVALGAGPSYVHGLNKWTAEIDQAIQKGDASDAYIGLDRVKREMQRRVDTLGRGLQNMADPLKRDATEETMRALESMQERTRRFLMDEGTWGAQGAAQREVNAAWERYIPAARNFEKTFLTQTGREYGGFGGARILEADPGKIDAFVNKVGRASGAMPQKFLNEYLDAAQQMTGALQKHYSLMPDQAKAVKAVFGNAAGVRDMMERAHDTVGLVNQFRELTEAQHGGGGSIVAGMLGLAAGGPVGALAGGAIGALRRPADMIRTLSSIEALSQRVEARTGRSLSDYFARLSGKPVKALGNGAIKRELAGAARKARKAGVPVALAAFRGNYTNDRDAYRARAQQVIDAMAGNGALIQQRVASALGPNVLAHAPQLAAAVAGKASTGAAFLASKLPAGLTDPTSMQPNLSPMNLSTTEIAKFARYWHAVTDPMSTLDSLSKGTLAPEQVEALKTVYPDFYRQLQGDVMRRIGEMDQTGTRIPYQARLQLDLMLDLNGAGDPTLQPGFAIRYQQSVAQSAQQQAAPPPKPVTQVANNYQSGSQSMASNLAGS